MLHCRHEIFITNSCCSSALSEGIFVRPQLTEQRRGSQCHIGTVCQSVTAPHIEFTLTFTPILSVQWIQFPNERGFRLWEETTAPGGKPCHTGRTSRVEPVFPKHLPQEILMDKQDARKLSLTLPHWSKPKHIDQQGYQANFPILEILF